MNDTTQTQDEDVRAADGADGATIPDDALEGVEDARETQLIPDRWMMESRRLVNWGSYEGYHEFRPSTDGKLPVTMLVGASESGKSTLVDAQISLLYPSGTPFNKASNSGRSERTDYTYLRGMVGVSDTGEGDGAVYLRGRDDDGMPQAVWGAIVDTYRNATTGQTLSFGKFMTLPAGGTGQDLRRTYVVWGRPIDPRAMDAHRGAAFTAAQFRTAYADCAIFTNANAFHARVWDTMGLSEEACRMLHKIQSADAPSNLDAIFKQGVLGVPDALAKARETVADYDGYARNFAAMEENTRRLRLLERIRDDHDAYEDLKAKAHAYDAVDQSTARGAGAIRAWALARMAGTVSEQVPHDEAGHRERVREAAAARRQCDDLERRVEGIREKIAGIDGGSLARLEAELAHATDDMERVRNNHGRMGQRFAQVGETMPEDAEAWQARHARATGDVQRLQTEAATLREREYDAASRRRDSQEELERLRQDLERQRDHRTRITRPMDDDRSLLCQATGLTPEDMPYVAELMDVRADAEEWRLAMNVAYGGLATTILVDRRHEKGFAAKVSRIPSGDMRRRNWRFVDVKPRHGADADGNRQGNASDAASAVVDAGEASDWLSDRLRYREDSPFAGWVRDQTRAARYDARCVDAIDDADERARQVQRDGQIKDGRRGQHGTKDASRIIGFVTKDYLDMLERQVEEARRRYADADQAYGEAQAASERIRQRQELDKAVAEVPWADVDMDGAAERVAGIRRDIEAIRSNPELAKLTAMRDELAGELDRARERSLGLDRQARDLEDALAAARSWLAANAQTSGESAQAPRAPFGDEVAASLGSVYDRQFMGRTDEGERAHMIILRGNGVRGSAAGTDSAGPFAAQAIAQIGAEIGRIRAGLLDQASVARGRVEERMRDYKDAYERDDDALTCGVEDYRYYQEQLDEQSRLTVEASTADEYANCLHKLYMDILMLRRTIRLDEDTIGEQLDRINQMLRGQTFGPRHGSLSLHANVRRPSPAFAASMRRVIGLLTDWERDPERDPAHAPRLFADCGRFIDTLRGELDKVKPNANGIKEYGARDLDPRGRSSFHAVVHHEDGDDERISSTGGRSGGALQELTSFVYGAALLYLLGGGSTTGEPSYTTLFLDEALIKADGRYTRRALAVLPRLGFQVVVSAPESKAGEIMQVSTKVYVTRKDPGTGLTSLSEASVADLRAQWEEL